LPTQRNNYHTRLVYRRLECCQCISGAHVQASTLKLYALAAVAQNQHAGSCLAKEDAVWRAVLSGTKGGTAAGTPKEASQAEGATAVVVERYVADPLDCLTHCCELEFSLMSSDTAVFWLHTRRPVYCCVVVLEHIISGSMVVKLTGSSNQISA
jgi:hypothetical protein